jgi:hypothetical protein
VKWAQTAWTLLRDVGLTGFGMWVIYTQVESMSPNAALLVVALGCIAPAARSAVATILSAPGSSSESLQSPEEPRSPHSTSSPPDGGGTVERQQHG